MLPRSLAAVFYSEAKETVKKHRAFRIYISMRIFTSLLLIIACLCAMGYVAYLMTCTDAGSNKRSQILGFFIMTAFLAIMLVVIDLHMTSVLSYNFNAQDKTKIAARKVEDLLQRYGKNLESFKGRKKT